MHRARRNLPGFSPRFVTRRRVVFVFLKGCSVSSPSSPSALPGEARGHIRVVYLGPVAPHWDVQSAYGDRSLIEEFRSRTLARLQLIPRHDPQFRRNHDRVVHDAEREAIELEWDFGMGVVSA